MINDRNKHLIGQARLLRRQGKTYNEIQLRLGVSVSKDKLQTWLRGIPRPPETNRTGMAKPELRRKARQMRAQGMTTTEITAAIGIGSGTICAWTKGISLSPEAVRRRGERVQRSRADVARTLHDRAVARSKKTSDRALAQVGALSERDLLLTGVCLYWAEGTKEKPWRRGGSVTFTNSDVTVIKTFLA